MCGIAGFWSKKHSGSLMETARAMGEAIRHRGPDDRGEWADSACGIALAHRRLSILDLSPEGHQPMHSAGGRYVIVFNGEVFNFAELRQELGAHAWRGHSDTEVMLAAFERWGVEASAKKFVGMFAFALWDTRERELYLVRDRLGIKPVYYGWQNGVFLFGSELKALRAHPAFQGEVDRGALALLMRHNYIPQPHSIYESIHKLPPGCIVRMRSADDHATPQAYWSAYEVARQGSLDPLRCSDTEAIGQLDELLTESVRLRMRADVPLGAFLSGGVDSSTVVALMQKQSARPVKTFSIGFDEEAYNEAGYAAEVARHLKTDHTQLIVRSREAQEVIPLLPHYYDEPFSDSSQIPTYLVSKLARTAVTISLSGDGGDELFAGYARYEITRKLWDRLRSTPRPLRKGIARGMMFLSASTWSRIYDLCKPVLPAGFRSRRPGEQMERLASLMDTDSPDRLYRSIVSHWEGPSALVRGASEPGTMLTTLDEFRELPDLTSRLMYLDLVTYLPDDILTKVDRASMAVSLEARVPLLDHRVVEFAWRVPPSMRVRDGKEKWLLRQVLYKYVPAEMIDRPKVGFGIPIGEWLRGPLRGWVEELLDPVKIAADGFFDAKIVERAKQEHLSGARNWQYQLWDLLMFQAWKQNVDDKVPAPTDAVSVL